MKSVKISTGSDDLNNVFDIDDIHTELLLLLKYFNEFCTENNIKYSLHGGTLLGAVREKGFIPWDDDVDITLTRSEYKKLRSLMQNDMKSDLKFKEFDAQKPMLWLCRKGRPKVWADIFIYDYISDNLIKKKLKIALMAFFLGLMKTKKTMEITKKGEFKGWKFRLIYILYIIGKLFPVKYKVQTLNYIAENLLIGDKKFVFRSNDQYAALKIILPKQVMDKYEYINFEDTKLMISMMYDEILTASYGDDYMIPKKVSENELNAHGIFRNDI